MDETTRRLMACYTKPEIGWVLEAGIWQGERRVWDPGAGAWVLQSAPSLEWYVVETIVAYHADPGDVANPQTSFKNTAALAASMAHARGEPAILRGKVGDFMRDFADHEMPNLVPFLSIEEVANAVCWYNTMICNARTFRATNRESEAQVFFPGVDNGHDVGVGLAQQAAVMKPNPHP